MDCIKKDWYCMQCSLQFDNKCIYDLHMKLVHEQILTKNIRNAKTAILPKVLLSAQQQDDQDDII